MTAHSLISVLLQAPDRSRDFLTETFSGFLGQIPFILILQVCVTAVLLVFAIAYFVNRRRRRAAQRQAAESAPAYDMPDSMPMPDPVYSDMQDMPDLDLLVDASVLEDVASPPVPAAPRLPIAPPPTRAPQPGLYTVKLHTGYTTQVNEVLSILRDTDDGRLVVQIGDTAYRTLLDTPDAKKLFTQIMRELSEVVTRPDDRAPESAAMPEPDAPPVIAPPVQAEAPPPPVKPAAPPPPRPKPAPGAPMPGDLPSYKLDDHPVEVKQGMLGRKRYESGPVPEFNIASAIESYLQHKLTQTPEYYGRQIHVRSAPGGGVRIQIDERFFDAVDDVDDPNIRTFLQETIQEWQDRQ